MVLKDGKIVLEKYFDAFTVDSLWYWASAGKTLTGFTVGIAQQEGYLNLSDTTSDYLGTGWTVCPPAKEEKITIWHQLTMTSGLDDGVPDHYCTLDTCLQYLADAGTRWAYHNGPYTLLDGVIQAATGQNLNTYFAAKVRNPIGMNGLFFPTGYNNVYYSNTRSFARFGLLMLNKGNWDGNQIMTDTNYFNQMVNTSQPLNPSYGYLTWLNGKSSFMAPGLQFNFPGSINPNAPADMYAALGKNGQMISIVPSSKMVVVRIGDSPSAGSVPFLMNDTIWQKLSDLTCSPTALESISDAIELQIVPNPTMGNVVLRNPSGLKINAIALMSIEGKQIFSKRINQSQDDIALEFGTVTKGIYFLRIETEQGATIRKLLIE